MNRAPPCRPDEYSDQDESAAKGTSFAPFSFACTLPCTNHTWYAAYLIATLSPTAVIAMACVVSALATRSSHPRTRHTLASTLTFTPGADERATDRNSVAVEHAKDSSSAASVSKLCFALSNLLVLIFFVPISSHVFQALDCDTLNQDVAAETYLRADYAISCDWGVDRMRPVWVAYTIVMLILWPVGVPCYFAFLFHRNRTGVRTMVHAHKRYRCRTEAFRQGMILMKHQTARTIGRERSKMSDLASVIASETTVEPRRVVSIERMLRHKKQWDPRDAPTGRLRHYESELLGSLNEGMHALRDVRWVQERAAMYELRCAWFDVQP